MRNIKLFSGVGIALALIAGLVFALPGGTVLAQDSLTPGTPTEGSLGSDDSLFTIDASAGQLILITLESDDFDAYLTLSDATGNEIAWDDSSASTDGYDDALLAAVAQADGTYTIAASGWGGEGNFVITANLVTPPMADLDSSITVTPEADAELAYAVFNASADTVVDIWATSTAAEPDDVDIELFGIDGLSIEYDFDDGPGYNALLRRVVLPADGYYLVLIETSWSDTPFTAPVDVQVDVTERLFITSEPYAVSLSEDDLGTEVFTFEATTGTVYRITATSALNTGVEMELFDTSSFFDPDFETGNAVKATWEYRSDVDGLVRLDVHPSFFSDGDDFTFMIETVE